MGISLDTTKYINFYVKLDEDRNVVQELLPPHTGTLDNKRLLVPVNPNTQNTPGIVTIDGVKCFTLKARLGHMKQKTGATAAFFMGNGKLQSVLSSPKNIAASRLLFALMLDPESTSLEAHELMAQMVRLNYYDGRLSETIVQWGNVLNKNLDLETYCTMRSYDVQFIKEETTMIRKTIIIDLNHLNKLFDQHRDNRNAVYEAIGQKTKDFWNRSMQWYKDVFDTIEMRKHPEHYMMAEDEWYPQEVFPEKWVCDDDVTCIENDNGGFGFESKKPLVTVGSVTELPNKEKLVEIRRREGNVHYIVVGEDINIARLPKIYSLMLQEKLRIKCNVTTKRLTRILEVDKMINEVGFTVKETSQYIDEPEYIIRSDLQILKQIEILTREEEAGPIKVDEDVAAG